MLRCEMKVEGGRGEARGGGGSVPHIIDILLEESRHFTIYFIYITNIRKTK